MRCSGCILNRAGNALWLFTNAICEYPFITICAGIIHWNLPSVAFHFRYRQLMIRHFGRTFALRMCIELCEKWFLQRLVFETLHFRVSQSIVDWRQTKFSKIYSRFDSIKMDSQLIAMNYVFPVDRNLFDWRVCHRFQFIWNMVQNAATRIGTHIKINFNCRAESQPKYKLHIGKTENLPFAWSVLDSRTQNFTFQEPENEMRWAINYLVVCANNSADRRRWQTNINSDC